MLIFVLNEHKEHYWLDTLFPWASGLCIVTTTQTKSTLLTKTPLPAAPLGTWSTVCRNNTSLFLDCQRRWSWVPNSCVTKGGKRFSPISNLKMHVKATASTAPVMWCNTHSAADLPTVSRFLLPFARQAWSESLLLRVYTPKKPAQISRRTRRKHRFLLGGYKWRRLFERNDLKPAEITGST